MLAKELRDGRNARRLTAYGTLWTDSPVGGPNPPEVPYAVPWVPYALTWIGIGVALLRGQPELDKPLLKPE